VQAFSSELIKVHTHAHSHARARALTHTHSLSRPLIVQARGHIRADLDPLGLHRLPPPKELDPATYGFAEADLDRLVYVGDDTHGGFLKTPRWIKLRELIDSMNRIYCGHIGFEYTHIQNQEELTWLQEKIEKGDIATTINAEKKKEILQRLVDADTLEVFLATKYATTKRFGLDGCESLVPGMEALIDKASELGVSHVVIGMAHRGRINVMANVMNKPLDALFHEFEGGNIVDTADGPQGSGDVKYHLGTSTDFTTKHGNNMHLSLVANPSHLEAVDPVVEGKARAKQHYLKDAERAKVLSIQLHGDAAFAGQGVVYETLDLSGLDAYTTGGTVHVIVNNQIGFTTDPVNSRGPREYCTDVAKCNSAPIFHVNADDPEAVVFCMETAMEFRKKFKKDVVIDIIGYRRFGHNENDQPTYTQPLMYRKIQSQKRTLELYSQRLVQEGVVTPQDIDATKRRVLGELEEAHKRGKEYKIVKNDWLESRWRGFLSPQQTMRIRNTGVPVEILRRIGSKLTELPSGFTVHRGIAKLLEQKAEMFSTGQKFDWATAEALAFGTLLLEGNHVRLSGQDVERGTFSHRHAVVHDQNNGSKHCFLNHLDAAQAERMTV
jgi:2-oxoglutarate dehydrogenase E1 component